MTGSITLSRVRMALIGAILVAAFVLVPSTKVGAVPPCADSAPIQWTSGSGANGHWYQRLCTDALIPWQTAQDAALAQGRYLATLTSQDENDFVLNNLIVSCGCNYWAGGQQASGQATTDAGWSWVNGEGAFVFTNWNSPPEPNDVYTPGENDEENCLEVNESGSWNDQNCALDSGDLLFGQIVEWEESTLEVRKFLWPFSDRGRFNLLIDGEIEKSNAGNGGTTGEVEVDAGEHVVKETGSNLSKYFTTLTCRDEDGTGDVVFSGIGPGPHSVDVEAGADIVCIMRNVRRPGS